MTRQNTYERTYCKTNGNPSLYFSFGFFIDSSPDTWDNDSSE